MGGTLIGGHVSTKGGFDQCIDRALAIGAEVIQTHPSQPQRWQPLRLTDAEVAGYREKAEAVRLGPHFFHAIYLINLATQDSTLLNRSVGSLVGSLKLAAQVGAAGVIFHPGSHKGAGFETMLPQIAEAIRTVLSRTTPGPLLIVENSAGQGGCVGCSFREVGMILDAAGPEAAGRVGVCLDTAHSFASGYDLSTAEGVDATVADFEAQVGFERLVAVHANDSKVPLSSNVDRHANIGEGYIGRDAFGLLLRHPKLQDLPWMLEVPGDGQGPTLEQVNLLRALAGRDPAVAREPVGAP